MEDESVKKMNQHLTNIDFYERIGQMEDSADDVTSAVYEVAKSLLNELIASGRIAELNENYQLNYRLLQNSYKLFRDHMDKVLDAEIKAHPYSCRLQMIKYYFDNHFKKLCSLGANVKDELGIIKYFFPESQIKNEYNINSFEGQVIEWHLFVFSFIRDVCVDAYWIKDDEDEE